MSSIARVDVHQHLLPRPYRAALERHGLAEAGPPGLPAAWSPESALALMDRFSIATSVLSISTPGIHLGGDAEAGELTQAVNEAQAELVKDRPDRCTYAAQPRPRHASARLGRSPSGLRLLPVDGGRFGFGRAPALR